MADINLKQKEVKTVTFTYNSSVAGSSIDDATLTYEIKQNIDDAASLVTKENADFDKTESASQIVTCVLTSSDLDMNGDYVSELKTVFTVTNVDKSPTFSVHIDKAVTD